MTRGESCSLRKWGYCLQVFRPETCRNVVFIYSFTIHCPFAPKIEWPLSVCCREFLVWLCLPLSPCYGTVHKYFNVCFVLMLYTLHPLCPCCSTIVWLASLQQKQREPSPSANSEIAWYSALSPREAPVHFLLQTSKRPHVEWLYWLESQCSPWSCEWVWKISSPRA